MVQVALEIRRQHLHRGVDVSVRVIVAETSEKIRAQERNN
jgi:hypothetical protein